MLADQKVAEIEKMYKLSFPDGMDLQSAVMERKKVVNKLQTALDQLRKEGTVDSILGKYL